MWGRLQSYARAVFSPLVDKYPNKTRLESIGHRAGYTRNSTAIVLLADGYEVREYGTSKFDEDPRQTTKASKATS